MTFPCLYCGSVNTASVNTKLRSGGKRWRMITCKDCNRFCEYIGGKPRNIDAPRSRPPLYHFTDATLKRILLTKCANTTMGEDVGCSAELIRQIRCGMLYKTRVPEVPRWGDKAPPPVINGPSCLVCVNRAGGDGPMCGMGFPDPDEEGPGFAVDCSLFAKERC